MVGNNYGTHPSLLSRHLTLQNLRNISFLVIFSRLHGGPRKVNDLLTSPSNQFRDHFIWNRIEKLVPLNWNFAPQTLFFLKEIDQLVFKPWLFAEIWVSKNPGFVPGYISRNDPQKNIFFWKCQKTSTIVIFWQNGYLCYAFFLFFLPPTPPFRFPPLHSESPHPRWTPSLLITTTE